MEEEILRDILAKLPKPGKNYEFSQKEVDKINSEINSIKSTKIEKRQQKIIDTFKKHSCELLIKTLEPLSKKQLLLLMGGAVVVCENMDYEIYDEFCNHYPEFGFDDDDF